VSQNISVPEFLFLIEIPRVNNTSGSLRHFIAKLFVF